MDMFAKESWLAALRSGKFKQGKGAMRRKEWKGDTYDPVGILSELFRREVKRGDWVMGHKFVARGSPKVATFVLGRDTIETRTGLRIRRWFAYGPPPDVMQWANLHYRDATRIMAMSDRGKTFEEIADWIEENIQDS
jgi:hypothetical protein